MWELFVRFSVLDFCSNFNFISSTVTVVTTAIYLAAYVSSLNSFFIMWELFVRFSVLDFRSNFNFISSTVTVVINIEAKSLIHVIFSIYL